MSSDDDDFDFSDDGFVPKKAAPAKKAAGTKRVATKPPAKRAAPAKQPRKVVSDVDDGSDQSFEVVQPKTTDGKTIEQIYQKKTPLEHVLLRPDTYVGSIESREEKMWVYDELVGMNHREISYVPGLYKIFDEILVNAADNFQRDKTMDKIQVTINADTNTISVWNNGQGIPVELHAEEKMHVPELIFGHLLTSSNYDDDMNKVTGGRNGYGAKLANIFSKHFSVECLDSKRKRKFFMQWENNMTKRHEPVIKSSTVKNDYTLVSFTPDLKRFNMKEFDKDIIALFTKRVYDIAGCNPKLKVYLNEQLIKISSFEKYVELYFEKKEVPHVFQQINDRWSVCVALSSSGQFQQVSFVNSICTTKGGTHVKYVTDKLTKDLLPLINKKNKGGAEIKGHQIKNYVWVFVNSLIVNPAFDSQTKETLTSQASKFGSKCELPAEFIQKISKKCTIVENVLQFAQFKQKQQLGRKGGSKKTRVTGIVKLEDANEAGGKNADKCTLILTEGDSAKTLAVSGLSVVGRDRYGVFPLKGKPLNVREATHKQIMDNAEFGHIMQILGLKPNLKYESTKGLRYGRLMIMTDQDHDGSHIKGLVINFVHHFWPDLLKTPGFLTEFITPIVKATKKSETISFYTMTEYETWKQENNNGLGWKVKYYKGLGTSSAQEAKEYFSELQRHKIDFSWTGEEDGDAIDMAFNKKRVEDRKTWISKFEPGTYLDQDVDELPYSDFIHKELIHFSIADCTRSIPSLVDGLKPGQRKILYTCLSKNIKEEIRVAQLSGSVSLHSAYHHGEESLNKAIVAMAHNFVGSNNINLLFPAGSFGSRLQGGKDAASPRYLHTRLCEITRLIFHPDDDKLLNYLDDDGQLVEPEFYVPIIPMSLVNGGEGIGTGWSTSIPNYNPKDIVDNIKRMLRNETPKEMLPWYRGFEGSLVDDTDGKIPRYRVTGIWNKPDSHTLEITELPIGVWTQFYKKFLETLLETDKKRNFIVVKEYTEHHTDSKVHFVITLTDEAAKWDDAEIEKMFKLSKFISMNNMHLYDRNGHIARYGSCLSVLQEFYDLRLEYYEKRKAYLTDTLNKQLSKLDNQVRFILGVIKKEIVVNNRKKVDLLKQLEDMGFDKFANDAKEKKKAKKATKAADDDDEEENESKAIKKAETGYNYLLSMPIWNLTMERVQKLQKLRDEKQGELDTLKATPIKDLWERDLDAFLDAFEIHQQEIRDIESRVPNSKKVGRGRRRAPPKRKPAPKKTKDDSDDDDFSAAPAKRAPAARARPTTAAAAKKQKMESDDDIPAPAPAKRAPAARKAATSAAAKKAEDAAQKKLDDMFKKPDSTAKTAAVPKAKEKDDYDSEDEIIAQTAKMGKKASVISIIDDEEDSDDGTSKAKEIPKEDSEMEESPIVVKRRPLNKAATTATTTATKKTKALVDLSSSDEDEEEEAKVVKKPAARGKAAVKPAAAPKGRAAAAKKKIQSDSDEESEEEPPKKAPAKRAAPAKKTAATTTARKPVAKKKAKEDSDEDEEDISEEDSEEEKPSKKPPPRRAAAPARVTKAKALKKKMKDDSDQDDDDDDEEEDDDNYSD